MSGSEKLKTGQCDDLKDKRAVVTGAGSGLGRSIAAGLSRAGAIVGLFDIDGKSAGETEVGSYLREDAAEPYDGYGQVKSCGPGEIDESHLAG